jgi:uncharacterized OB-fold protein
MAQDVKKPELIQLTYSVPRPYRWSSGKYMGKTFREAKDHKKIVTNRCPKCRELLWPPAGVCGRCKVEAGEEWVEVSDKGTVLQFTYLVMPMWNPHMGERWANPYPIASILLDGGLYILHFLEERDPKKLKDGMRVQAVWREQTLGRGAQGVSDILYYRTIQEASK